MNTLTHEMKRSLRELDLGLKGELTITSDMEDLSNSLFFDQVRIGKIGDFFNNPILLEAKVSLWFTPVRQLVSQSVSPTWLSHRGAFASPQSWIGLFAI